MKSVVNLLAIGGAEIAFIILAVVLAVAIGALVFIIFKFLKPVAYFKKGGNKAGSVEVIDDVRYTESDNITDESGAVNVTHKENDIILERGKTYTARKGSVLLPGKYTVLSADGDDSFNLRTSGLVRTYKHGDSVVLVEGSKISAVSHTVILR